MYKIAGRDNILKFIPKSLNKVPQKGLLINWDMKKIVGTTIYDRSSNINNGILYNSILDQGIKGLSKSIYCNGSNSKIQLDNFFQATDTEYSYEIWFKVYPGWASTTRIFFAYEGSSRGAIVTYNPNKTIEIITHGATVTTTETFDDNKWHHIVVSQNAGVLKVTIDNQIEHSSSGSFVTFLDNTDLCLGISVANTLAWKGYIGKFRLWNRVLIEEEINCLYNNGWGV